MIDLPKNFKNKLHYLIFALNPLIISHLQMTMITFYRHVQIHCPKSRLLSSEFLSLSGK